MSTRAQRRHARPKKKRSIAFPLAITVLVVLGGLLIYLARGEGTRTARPDPPEGTQTFTGLSRSHVEGPVDYDVIPPPGGPHWNAIMNCGFYDEPIVTEAAVHSLEHGAVWITWDADLPDDQVRRIRSLVRGRSHALASPWPDQRHPAPVVASAWGHQIHLESADDPRLEEFLAAFHRGPQTPEPGAACHGGIGNPAR